MEPEPDEVLVVVSLGDEAFDPARQANDLIRPTASAYDCYCILAHANLALCHGSRWAGDRVT